MKYYLQLQKANEHFRLQIDNTWRKLSDSVILENDFLTADPDFILSAHEKDSGILSNTASNIESPSYTRIFSDNMHFFHVFVIRDLKPDTPSRDQLVSVIGNGNDDLTNLLILNTSGIYEVRDIDTFNLNLKYPSIVVRSEAFIEGNGYVGKEASEDVSFIDRLYNDTLECWLIHLEKGITNMYSDGSNIHRGINEVLNEIFKLKI
ncbi:hypothetical protein [uncultured Flavobacterium sp.]|uniref:hypothetical protein n=1 Tax=uncultured Flavobacterium sp. TaxID=165435 RepID=UPI002597321D|nr:hypothetical protein [uncultured Flavobacterium sp.]